MGFWLNHRSTLDKESPLPVLMNGDRTDTFFEHEVGKVGAPAGMGLVEQRLKLIEARLERIEAVLLNSRESYP